MEVPTDKYSALIVGVLAAGIDLVVAFGVSLSQDQKYVVITFVTVVVALVQAVVTRKVTTDNAVVVVKAEDGVAVASAGSVYDNGTPLSTVPEAASGRLQSDLISGLVKPLDTDYVRSTA